MAIAVRIKDLTKMLETLIKDGIEYVDVDILEAQEFDGEIIPAILYFNGYDGIGGGIDYEGIEEVNISGTYKYDQVGDFCTKSF